MILFHVCVVRAYKFGRHLQHHVVPVWIAVRSKRSIQREGQQEEADRHDFWPTTYVLPGEYALFAEESKRRANSKWIMKPIARSQGRYVTGTPDNGCSKWARELQAVTLACPRAVPTKF